MSKRDFIYQMNKGGREKMNKFIFDSLRRKIILGGCLLSLVIIGSDIANAEQTFKEIVLGDYLKDPTINKINSLVEEAEATLDKPKLNLLENSLKNEINKKTEPRFLYYYFLARVYFAYSNLYEYMENKEKVKEFLELALVNSQKSVNYNKNFSDGHRILGDIYGRLIHLKNPVIYGVIYGPRSIREAELAIKLEPSNPEAYLARGRGYFYTPTAFGGSMKRAKEFFEKAQEVCPNYYFTYMWLGKWYLEKGEISKAEECFHKTLELRPNFGWAIHELKKIEEFKGKK